VNSVGGNAEWLGFTVGCFSFGRVISTLGLGYLSTQSAYKKVLSWSVLICVIGNILYSVAYEGGIYLLITSRFVLGFGAGTLSVIRAYVVEVTRQTERTFFMAIVGAVQFLGFAIMPGAGSLLSLFPNYSIKGLRIDAFTTPGWTLGFLNLVALLLLVFKFRDPIPNDEDRIVNINSKKKADKPKPKFTKNVWISFFVFLALNFLVRAVLSIVETFGTPIYRKLHPNPNASDTDNSGTTEVASTGYLFAGFGIVGVFVLLSIGAFTKRNVPDFAVLLVGLVSLILGCGLLIGENLGFARFIIGVGIIWSFGFPLAQTVIVSMFSKKLGPGPQGTVMGWIGSVGSCGRIVGPILSGVLYRRFGQSSIFVFGLAASVFSLVLCFGLFPDILRDIKRRIQRRNAHIETMEQNPYVITPGGSAQ